MVNAKADLWSLLLSQQISAYTLSWGLAELPWLALQSVMFAVPFYYLCHYDPSPAKFGWFLAFHFLLNVWNCEFRG
jgi:hypothetical protein